MEVWARDAFQSPREEEVVESLLEFCGVYPHSGLPDVLGKRCVARCWARSISRKRRRGLVLFPFDPHWLFTHAHCSVEACVEHLMAAGKNKEGLQIIRRCLEAPWAQEQKVWCVRYPLFLLLADGSGSGGWVTKRIVWL